MILLKLFGYWRVNLPMINKSTQRERRCRRKRRRRRRVTGSLQVMLSRGISNVLSPTIHPLSIFVIISLIVTVYLLQESFARVYTNRNRSINWLGSGIAIEQKGKERRARCIRNDLTNYFSSLGTAEQRLLIEILRTVRKASADQLVDTNAIWAREKISIVRERKRAENRMGFDLDQLDWYSIYIVVSLWNAWQCFWLAQRKDFRDQAGTWLIRFHVSLPFQTTSTLNRQSRNETFSCWRGLPDEKRRSAATILPEGRGDRSTRWEMYS